MVLPYKDRGAMAEKDQPEFPRKQLLILALVRVCEPIAFMSVFPYVYYMVQSFRVTTDDRQISFYAGMITSSFALAEFSTSILWGRLSDKIGRKPVLILGLFGTMISMLAFGFASSLPVALLGRALGGFLNGNIGVLQTMVAEIVTQKEHQPRAYSIMPFVWCLGSILGPALGGALAQPSKGYPSLFGPGTFFDRYPFALPNILCAAILIIGMVIGFLFLEETHAERKRNLDIGLRMGDWILRRSHFVQRSHKADKEVSINLWEKYHLLEKDLPPGYNRREETSTSRPRTLSPSPMFAENEGATEQIRGVGIRGAITRNVLLNIVGFGILAFHSISFDTLVPLFLSTPTSGQAVDSLWKFTGGFGLSPKTIGFMLAVQGIYSMVAQLVLFPHLVRRFGELITFRIVAVSFPLLYFLTPYTTLLPDNLQYSAVFLCLLWKITAHVIAFPSMALLLTNSAPSMLVLGTINGIAASTASLSRAFGPTVSGMLQTAGNKLGYVGLAFWVCSFVSILGALESFYMGEGGGRLDQLRAGDRSSKCVPDPYEIEAALMDAKLSDEKSG